MTSTSSITTARPETAAGGHHSRPPVAFYSVSDARFFLGLVALLNSLRIHGHEDPIYVVDCGLTDRQRELLARHVTILDAPAELEPHLLKYVGPMHSAADVMLVIDADMIVTRSLTPLIDAAGEDRVVAFADPLPDRFFAKWETLLALPKLRRQPYVNAGFLALPHDRGLDLLRRLETGQAMIDGGDTIWSGGSAENPTYFADQDVLNALLSSVVPQSNVCILEQELAPNPPFADVTVVDPAEASCAYPDGRAPFILHQMLKQKPWLTPMRSSPYARLLPRLWLAEDVAIRLPEEEVPVRFRHGPLATVERRRAAVAAAVRQAPRLGLRSYVRARWHARANARSA